MTSQTHAAERTTCITPPTPKLGALHCGTIVCEDLQQAVNLYQSALDFEVVETGQLDAELSKAWGAPALAGAKWAVLKPMSGAATYLRFIEDKTPASTPPEPYASLGWAALEYSVKSSDAAIEKLVQHGFRVLGPAQDLDFSEGALRAGQVVGPFGEILYLTQINRQLDGFTLPEAKHQIDSLFITILVVDNVAEATSYYGEHFGTRDTGAFDAGVDFIADYRQLPSDHIFQFGCVETVPESYIELDAIPGGVPRRERVEGRLPAGISIISFVVSSLDPFLKAGVSLIPGHESIVYAGRRSALMTGQSGELIEIIESPSTD